MAVHGYTKNYKLIKPQFDTDTWHDYEYDNLDTIDAVLSAIFASGDWKGFWKTNTHYSVGGVVIDQATDTMYKIMVEHTSSAATFSEEQAAHPDYYELWSPNNLAESWAIKTDGKVSNEDYSAKAYAISSGLIDDGSAKEWAIGSGAIGNTNEYSAKKYATDAHNDYISMTTNPNVAAVGSNINNVNAVGQSISNVNTVANNVQSVNTVAGVSTDVTTVSGISTDVSTVANNSANITTVATNISDVNTAATNIEAIKNAPTAATNAAQSATNAANSATDSANSATASATSAQAAQDAADKVQGLIATPIGTIFQSIYVDESLDIARQLNGQLISSTKFTGFRSWLNTVQTATPNLFTTETNWQAEKTNSKLGQCGKFVVDDTAGTIRLPCVVNAQGLVDLALIGGIKSESLPNFQANLGDVFPYTEQSGAVTSTKKTVGWTIYPGSNYVNGDTTVNPSVTSSTYQDNAPVQQEAVQYPYYIQVATGFEETLPAIREYNINTPFFFGQSMYSDVAPDNASWLASNGQYNAKTVYPDYYNWLLEQMNAGVSGFVASTAAYTDYDFVINTTDQTFRLPLKNGQEGVFADGVKGNGVGLGLTESSINYGIIQGTIGSSQNYALVQCVSSYGENTGTKHPEGTHSGINGGVVGLTTDPSKSGMVVDKTVPSGWNLYYYIGDTVQDASLINACAVLGQLSDKISRTAASDKELVVGWGMPDYSAGVSKALNTSITATRNCFVVVFSSNSTNTAGLYVNDVKIGVGGNLYSSSYVYLTAYVAKGQTYKTENITTYGSYVGSVTEYPLIGG